jgi:hypothetical protein
MLDPDFLICELLTVPPDLAALAAAEISGCEAGSADAELPFDWILADAMNRPGMFEFILAAPVRCPLCHGPVTEKTLVDRVGGIEVGSLHE